MKSYVLSHDFGYGKDKEINKLKLRNKEDVIVYLEQLIKDNFDINANIEISLILKNLNTKIEIINK